MFAVVARLPPRCARRDAIERLDATPDAVTALVVVAVVPMTERRALADDACGSPSLHLYPN